VAESEIAFPNDVNIASIRKDKRARLDTWREVSGEFGVTMLDRPLREFIKT
jgi:hypothetical protein